MSWPARGNLALLLCLMAGTISGCSVRRGFVVRWDWAFQAHRVGAQPKGECPPPSASAAPPAAASDCTTCGPARRPRRVRDAAPPEPEETAPTYFHPVPMGPVFGPRSEQPDGIEEEAKPLSPEMLPPLPPSATPLLPIPQSMPVERGPGGELLPPASSEELGDEPDEDPPAGNEASNRPSRAGRGQLRFPASSSAAVVTGWRVAQPRTTAASCANCSLRPGLRSASRDTSRGQK
jgi:hypothetical protein